MAQKIDKLVLQILADNKDAVKKIMQVQNKSQVMTKKSAGFFKSLKAGWLAVAVGIGVALRAMSSIVKDTFAHEKAVAKLNNQLIKNGTATKAQVRELLRYNNVLQTTTGYSNDEISAAQAMLGTFKLSADQIKLLTPRLIDMAAATETLTGDQINLQQVSIQVGKVFTGYESSLARMGVTLTDTEKKQLKLATGMDKTRLLVKILDNNFKGTAETIGKTFPGQVRILSQSLSDVRKMIGKKMIEEMSPTLKKLNEFIASAKGIETISKSVKVLFISFELLKRPLLDFITIFKMFLLPVIYGFKAIGQAIDDIKNGKIPSFKTITIDAIKGIKTELFDTTKGMKERYVGMFEDFKELFKKMDLTAKESTEFQGGLNKISLQTDTEIIEQKKANIKDYYTFIDDQRTLNRMKEEEDYEKAREGLILKLEEEGIINQENDERMLELKRLHNENMELIEDESLARRKAAEEQLQKDITDIMKTAAGNVASGFADAVTDVIFESNKMKKNFGEVMLDMIKNVGKLIVKMLILKGIQAAFRFFGFGFSQGGMVGMQTGGQFRGKAGADKNVVRMTDKEYVINAPTAKKNIDFLNWLNFGKIDMSKFMVLPKYQAGGQVGGVNNTTNDNTRTINIDTLTVPARTPVETLLELQEVADQMGLSLVVRE